MDGVKLGYRSYKKASCVLALSEQFKHIRAAELIELKTQERHRNNGFATALIQQIITDADDVGVCIIIHATSDRLKNFYEKFGFVAFQTEPVILMARPAKGIFSD